MEEGVRAGSAKRPRDDSISIQSKRIVQAKKSVASVFLQPQLSITNRLGRHLQVDKYTSEGVLLDEDQMKESKKKKKARECKLFCCNRAEKTCMEKGAWTWIRIFLFLFLFWIFCVGLMYVFYEIFIAIEGPPPVKGSANFKDRTPLLTSVKTVEKNVKHGWEGGYVKFPYKYGSQLFFPGVQTLSREKTFLFPTKEDGHPTDEWYKEKYEEYEKYFADNYTTPSVDVPGCSGGFRPLSEIASSCPWPRSKNTRKETLKPSYCETDKTTGNEIKDKDGKYSCFPILYFTINDLVGWIPQKKAASDKCGQIFCEILDSHLINKNSGIKKGDFSGNTSYGSCANSCEGDLCGFNMARFPFTGQQGQKPPIIQYHVTKMPRKKTFIIHCRIDYPGYKKQMNLKYPYDSRKERAWTTIRISGAEARLGGVTLLLFSLAASLIISN